MYKTNSFNFRHALADSPLVMPINILLALPDYITDSKHDEWLFNLPGAINDLMGSAGWQSATQVMKPYIWAPNWTDEKLHNFAATPFGRNKYRFPKIEATELRGISRQYFARTSKQYEIVHFVGNVLIEENGVTLDAGRKLSYDEIRYGLLNGTRLLILQNLGFGFQINPDEYLAAGARLAQALIADGGPPVLIMAAAETPQFSNDYLADVYANIVHDLPLSEVARPKPDIDPGVRVELFLGDGGEEILRLTPLFEQLYSRVQTARERVESLRKGTHREIFNDKVQYLDERTKEVYKSRLEGIDSRLEQQVFDVIEKMHDVRRELDFSRETGGAIPLAESSAAMATVDEKIAQVNESYARSLDSLTLDLNVEAQTAARVLNAGFADPSKGNVLGPKEPLISGREYDFLIDVGPKWNRAQSLVVGSEVFPEFALPPDETGYPIHVIFISSDLEQKFFSAWIYLPRKTGRSFPYNPSTKSEADKSGPIAFRFKAPALKDGKPSELHGRVCLYYRNNLLQSARVQATLAGDTDVIPKVDNVVEVDYVISGTVQDLDTYATRKLKFIPNEEPKDHPITVNVTLNDDGKDHRILVRQLDELPTTPPSSNSPLGWTPFDPAAARWALEQARENLKSCFFLRDEKTGKSVLDSAGEPTIGLSESQDRDKNNAKTKKQFLWDLNILARFGRELFDRIFGDVRPEGDWPTKADWTRSLRTTLENSSIIQVARTGPANYVFPWALIYQYPLVGPNDRIKFCRVTEEWNESGKRNAPLAKNCPHRNEPWHAINIICPYGFWGLNHIIEQPIPALRKLSDGSYVFEDVTDKILMGPVNLDLSVGVTRDLSPDDVKNHLKRLGAISPLRLQPPDPADDTDKVRAMLNAAMVVYFLCHGEYDTARGLPFLSIGLRDTQDLHRIYPNTLQGWADAADLKDWGKPRRPLVFINGCHTTNLTPGEVLNFVTALGFAGAGGVIGTEVSVLANVAIEVAESLFEKIAGHMPVPVGQAMYQTRWELANKGNLLGLAYSLYCLANLHVTKN